MSSTNRCPQCDAPLSVDSPLAPCPACLMQLGLTAGLDSLDEGWGQSPALGPTHIPSPGHAPLKNDKLPLPSELAALFPELEIVKLLGHGGMGAVYQARQTALDRSVALKIIRPEVAGESDFAERFVREGRVLARLSHPSIVMIHDFGQRAGLHFLIMEYVDGVNLRQILQAGRMSPEEALRIIPYLCQALQYAHEEGIVHRDIKPENILLDRKGRVKIADFGLARLVGNEAESINLTGTRQVVGTPRYMAPEQMQGARTVDHRADIYSLGVVFYEMLTGEVPIGRFAPPSHHATLDRRLDDVVLRALDAEPDRRYQRASEIQTDLDSISQSSSVSNRPTAVLSPQQTGDRATLPAIFQLIIGAIQILGGLGFFVMMMAEQSSETKWVLLLLIGASLLSSLTGCVAALGAIQFFVTGSVRGLRWGAAALMFPIGITWVLGMPVGLWTLSTTAPGRSGDVPGEARQDTSPLSYLGILHLIAGMVNPVIFALMFCLAFTAKVEGIGGYQGPTGFLLLIWVPILFESVATVICAIGFLITWKRTWLCAGSIVLLIPISFIWFLSVPLGLWTLYVLSRQRNRTPTFRPHNAPPPVIAAYTGQPAEPVAPPLSQSQFVPWSGLGWVQNAVHRVPRKYRWLTVAACVVVLVAAWWGLQVFSGGSLIAAVQSGSTWSVRFWLTIGSDIETRGEQGLTPLMWAVWNRHPDVAQQLILAGADVNQKSNDGETALMKATYRGQLSIVTMLLQHHATVNESDSDGETALALAASEGHVAIVEQLLANQADPRAATRKGWTPLMAASLNGHTAIVGLLLPVSQVNVGDHIGETALMKAASHGHSGIVQTLLNANANVNVANTAGSTATSYAIAGGHAAVVDMLLSHGAEKSALVSLYQGYRAARAGQFENALPMLQQAAATHSKFPGPWVLTVDNWQYTVDSPMNYLWLLVGECEQRLGHRAAAQAAFQKALDNAQKQGTSLALFQRRFHRPERTIVERFELLIAEISQHIVEPQRPWHMSRRYQDESRSPGSSMSNSGTSDNDVFDLFK